MRSTKPLVRELRILAVRCSMSWSASSSTQRPCSGRPGLMLTSLRSSSLAMR